MYYYMYIRVHVQYMSIVMYSDMVTLPAQGTIMGDSFEKVNEMESWLVAKKSSPTYNLHAYVQDILSPTVDKQKYSSVLQVRFKFLLI